MARIFDVVEYPDEMRDEIVHRFPESGYGDFRIGSQVIVRESQNRRFFSVMAMPWMFSVLDAIPLRPQIFPWVI